VPVTASATARRHAFGAQVRDLRAIQKLSQEQLADQSGLHRTYIGGVERGERNISLDAIWKIAEALGITPADLFGSTPVNSE